MRSRPARTPTRSSPRPPPPSRGWCGREPAPCLPGMSTPTTHDLRDIDLDIAGMTCASCAQRVERSLNQLDGVTASVNLATERAHVSYLDGVVAGDLIDVVRRAGYDAAVPSDDETETSSPRPTRLLVSAVLTLPVVVWA